MLETFTSSVDSKYDLVLENQIIRID